jgi:hypothetical protein
MLMADLPRPAINGALMGARYSLEHCDGSAEILNSLFRPAVERANGMTDIHQDRRPMLN